MTYQRLRCKGKEEKNVCGAKSHDGSLSTQEQPEGYAKGTSSKADGLADSNTYAKQEHRRQQTRSLGEASGKAGSFVQDTSTMSKDPQITRQSSNTNFAVVDLPSYGTGIHRGSLRSGLCQGSSSGVAGEEQEEGGGGRAGCCTVLWVDGGVCMANCFQGVTPVQEETTYTAAKPTHCSTVKVAMTLNGTVSTKGTCPFLSNLHQNDTVTTMMYPHIQHISSQSKHMA